MHGVYEGCRCITAQKQPPKTVDYFRTLSVVTNHPSHLLPKATLVTSAYRGGEPPILQYHHMIQVE